MALLASGCFCLNADDFVECSCPDYSNCPKYKANCPPQEEMSYLGFNRIQEADAVYSFLNSALLWL